MWRHVPLYARRLSRLLQRMLGGAVRPAAPPVLAVEQVSFRPVCPVVIAQYFQQALRYGHITALGTLPFYYPELLALAVDVNYAKVQGFA